MENCHEPIVSKQTFEEAHKVINKTTCNRTKKQGSYKKAIIICGCCGKGLGQILMGIISVAAIMILVNITVAMSE